MADNHFCASQSHKPIGGRMQRVVKLQHNKAAQRRANALDHGQPLKEVDAMSVPDPQDQAERRFRTSKARLLKEATALSYRLHDLTVYLDAIHRPCADTRRCAVCQRRHHAYHLKMIAFKRLQRRAAMRYYVRAVVTVDLHNDRLRFDVFQRDNYTCQACGRTPKDGVPLEVDHIVPRTAGGSNDLSNLQILCAQCNVGKSNRDVSAKMIISNPTRKPRLTPEQRRDRDRRRLAEWLRAA